MTAAKLSAIVLAGRREGRVEPLAEAFGQTEKCLVPVAGVPLIEHVLGTLAASDRVGRIIVSINDPKIIETLPVAGALIREGRLLAVKAKGNLADSVLDAASHAEFPLIITTADNVLLTPQAVMNFEEVSVRQGADAAAAFAAKSSILAAHEDGQRRFYEFADDGYSNCNCYWIANKAALATAETFRSGGQFAKNPMRIVKVFGLWNLIRFRLGRDTLARAFERISNKLGFRLYPVIFQDGSLAIDVDNERTHRVATEILARRNPMRDAA
jgi:GTP:adenosylcobinamide-phosphate guanylyltransferase